jgi:putative transposase
VIMPNHFHLLLTPAAEIPLEKALQFIKGGFSYRAKWEINFPLEIWQASFVNHRIRDTEDKHHHTYISENPLRAGLSERPELFAWSSASLRVELDAPPPGLKVQFAPQQFNGSNLLSFAQSLLNGISQLHPPTTRFPANLDSSGETSLRRYTLACPVLT